MPRYYAAGLRLGIIPVGFNALFGFESQPMEFLTGFTFLSSHIIFEVRLGHACLSESSKNEKRFAIKEQVPMASRKWRKR
jgi:hypothetical protein